ncbi:MFS transporter [Roseomonas haemaphysalidis]|uniref:MFS transporter n=1 Tax=Roseomonas haemaphysalidis TaxID=2768162 RepID=A0ABS3KN21_9PROT|nr:MFS transporter [Roseomonas haemaphysalidis]MBO1078864.1 MFS transporter [Roseomonas haemaphysalidis]
MTVPAAPAPLPEKDRDWPVIGLIGTAHFLSHFYMLCLAPLFPVWKEEFGVSYTTLGFSIALMSTVTAVLQTPVGFLVDRQGARRYLVGGTLVMALSISAMAFAPNFGTILALALLSGVGNSVIHPADYAILAGSINKSRMGRAFSMHTMTGNLGFAAAPPIIAALALGLGWREALLLVGLLGVPVVAAILWQSRILTDQPKPRAAAGEATGANLLFSKPMLLFFAFFWLSSMASSGFQAFAIPVMGVLWGLPVAMGSTLLTGYFVGNILGVLAGGWFADHSKRHGAFVVGLTLVAVALILALGAVPLPPAGAIVVALLAGLALGASRTPRDVMVKDAAPPGQIGKVFGFISSGLPLGGAMTPAVGLLLDHGLPHLVMPLVAGLLALSLLCMGTAKGSARQAAAAIPAE